ncbi:NAD(P)-dependent oxidoreductase [Chelativorans salis]|uniref:NAD(P)-dependent oxidoreductase n=1 Tax=Chelativorans salis TaxID=2978478 RepID=A0ABT2LXA4_9HYPH|nr:NAD(P)-dependent oxidoreductase [Chelativorans sp. EGI FJ00035]MCT7378018.1 NAD(P)-dependent oxidoreductase [Chelativorans sp. EGI FJ00035]
MSKPDIGFIGLGLMGSAMVQRLLDCGYGMSVLGNRNRAGVEAAVSRGASEAANGRELAAASDIVMLCMDTSASVEARMFGEDGVITGLKPGAVAIDFGTSLPASTRRIGEAVAAAGATYMDAPLGRTPAHGREGKLNIMCAGDEATFQRIRPVLDDLGENVFHLGALGSGHTIKLINNFYAMTTAAAMAEAFAMSDRTGVSRQALYDVLSAGPNKSGMMDFMKAYAVDGDPKQLAFAVRNAKKDVGYYAAMAEDSGGVSIMSGSTKLALNLAAGGAFGERMVPELVDFFSSLTRQDG